MHFRLLAYSFNLTLVMLSQLVCLGSHVPASVSDTINTAAIHASLVWLHNLHRTAPLACNRLSAAIANW